MSALPAFLTADEVEVLVSIERTSRIFDGLPVPVLLAVGAIRAPAAAVLARGMVPRGYLVRHRSGASEAFELSDSARVRLQEALDDLRAWDSIRTLAAPQEPAQDCQEPVTAAPAEQP